MIPAFILNLVIGWLGPSKAKFAKPLIYGAAILLAIGAFFGGKALYDRSVVSHHEMKAENKQLKLERKADANLQTQVTRDDAAAQQRQQEITDATASIPDQRPSARQRAIACVELRREAQQRRKPIPAC
jgi:hypothetical protein